jgi:hypothetical protein
MNPTRGNSSPAAFQRLVDLGFREGGVGPEGDSSAFRLVAHFFGQPQLLPVVGARDVAGTEFRGEAVAGLVEQEQRVVADDAKWPL